MNYVSISLAQWPVSTHVTVLSASIEFNSKGGTDGYLATKFRLLKKFFVPMGEICWVPLSLMKSGTTGPQTVLSEVQQPNAQFCLTLQYVTTHPPNLKENVCHDLISDPQVLFLIYLGGRWLDGFQQLQI